MKLVKSLLLAAPAAILAVGASAADLPSKKASPVSYVKVCDAYGAGFFYIPGTDTCLKVGGYVRAEYSIQQRGNQAATTAAAATLARSEDATGWRTRGRVDLDARTQSAWGTVRTVMGLRLQSQSGVYAAGNGTVSSGALATAPAPAVALEAAFVQFAGFTAGRAAENFAFVPPFAFSGGHMWAGFPTGVKQLAYTATFGGGFSATIALEDHFDMGMSAQANVIGTTAGTPPATTFATVVYPQTMPALIGNVRLDQAWGSAQVMGAVQKNEASLAAANSSTTGWAIGGGLKVNLPMIAAGDALWLTAAYADGFTDMTVGAGLSTNAGDQFDMLRGAQRSDYSYTVDTNGVAHNNKSWSVGGLLVHYWAPTWRSVVGVSYGRITPASALTTATWANGGLSNASLFNTTASLIWSPVQNFDIGAEIQYRKLNQSATLAGAGITNVATSPSDLGARVRVQRTF